MRMYQKRYYNVPEHKNYGRCECGGMYAQSKQNNKFKCDKCGNYQPIGSKTIQCIDCKEWFEVDAKANNIKRCDECSKIAWKEYNKAKQREYYQKKKHNSV